MPPIVYRIRKPYFPLPFSSDEPSQWDKAPDTVENVPGMSKIYVGMKLFFTPDTLYKAEPTGDKRPDDADPVFVRHTPTPNLILNPIL